MERRPCETDSRAMEVYPTEKALAVYGALKDVPLFKKETRRVKDSYMITTNSKHFASKVNVYIAVNVSETKHAHGKTKVPCW